MRCSEATRFTTFIQQPNTEFDKYNQSQLDGLGTTQVPSDTHTVTGVKTEVHPCVSEDFQRRCCIPALV